MNDFFGLNLPGGGFLMLLVLVWILYWKARALWCSARQGEKYWFGALLVLNTLGILEILYLYYFSKKQDKTGKPVEDFTVKQN